MNEFDEVPLAGGNVNANVVRVGETVRRQMGNASPAVHQLLLHLETKVFAHSPRFLGIDEQDREILSYIPGETGIPEFIWQGDEPVTAAATMLRDYHEATARFEPPADSVWGYVYPDPKQHEVICHNDFAPYNWVYQKGLPVAVFDFDLAGPGPRLRDVACAAYWLAPLSFHSAGQVAYAETDLANGSRRLHLFCETYGLPVNDELLDMVAEVLERMGSETAMREALGESTMAKLKAEGHLAHWQRELLAFQENRGRLIGNIG